MKEKRELTFLEMEEIINKVYVTNKDIMLLLHLSSDGAKKVIAEIREDMRAEGRTVVYDRPPTVPTIRVMKYSDYTIDYIRKQAKAMKGTMSV